MDEILLEDSGKDKVKRVDRSRPKADNGLNQIKTYEKPVTRRANGIEVPKRTISFSDIHAGSKKGTKSKQSSNLNKKLDDPVKPKSVACNSKNDNSSNASALINPDPSKYVLTTWGDTSFLGKRKALPKAIQEEADIYDLDDGIQVTINEDNEELDFDEEGLELLENSDPSQNESRMNSEEEVELGGSAKSVTKKMNSTGQKQTQQKQDKTNHTTVEPLPGTSSMTDEERQLLNDNPRVHSILNKLLDHRLKNFVPQVNGSANGSVTTGKGSQVKTNQHGNTLTQANIKTNNMIKSPSDMTIYAPALNKQQNFGGNGVVANVKTISGTNDNLIENFVAAVRNEVEEEQMVYKTKDPGANEEARRLSQRELIQAEKFRENVEIPPEGNISHLNDQILMLSVDPGCNQDNRHNSFVVNEQLVHHSP